ncbi:unnamed protein product, partial [Vitis vinifera]
MVWWSVGKIFRSELKCESKLREMKKKQKPISQSDPDSDLKSVIHQHSLFFDKLIELIPARFYLPSDNTDKPWFQGLSKAAKASAKKQSKENIKKARRDRLDPEKSSTTLDLLNQSLRNEELDSESDGEADIKPMISGLENDERSVTYEELRQRLHRRIEELQSGRKKNKDDQLKISDSAAKLTEDASEASKELTFGHVKIGNKEELGKKKKRKLSKLKELEKAKKLEEEKKDPEKGKIISKKHSWQAATSRAAGIKVHDDPKLLKQSIHKGKKRHQKNVEKWKERVETRDKMRAQKQQTRSENIGERIHQKKMRRIAKREKKLMRPGFEGRKEGFITKDKA